jgi:hypothetical protein
VLIKVPPGVTTVSVQQQEFSVDRFGIITVPDHLGDYLLGLGVGFTVATERPPPLGEAAESLAEAPIVEEAGGEAPASLSGTLTAAILRGRGDGESTRPRES